MIGGRSSSPDLGARRSRSAARFLMGGVVAIFVAFLAAFSTRSTAGSGIALLVLVVAVVAASIRPVLGVYAIVFFTLIGDGETVRWFPFAKSLSTPESLLYVSGQLIVSPLEVLLVMTTIFWLLERFGGAPQPLVKGPLFGLTAAFTGFTVFGYMHGIATGGDPRIAIFEGRDLFVVFPLYVLITNLCDSRTVRRLLWTAVAAIVINALFGLRYLYAMTNLQRETLEELGEHAASVHFNVVILLAVIVFLYRAGNRASRMLVLALLIPVLVVYLAAQRRSAIAALLIGLVIVVMSLWWHHRIKFLIIGPMLLLGVAGYTAAFWNSTSSAGFPAQAVKTLVDENEASEDDRGSDLYRVYETFDLNFTIRTAPVLGLGFGHKFLRPIPLPDLSFFEFFEYIPHNSMLWIWVKMGFGGFFVMMLMFAIAVRAGGRSVVAADDPTGVTVALIGTTYVVMFVVFAFVDIAWDPRSMVMLALAFGICTQSERSTLVQTPVRPNVSDNELVPIV